MSKILIADDSALARAFMTRCIQISGIPDCEFFEASNGNEVLKTLESFLPDLVITDMNMPECDGMELVKKIKSNPKFSAIPIVVMTSAGNTAQRAELKSLGVSSILSKPFNPHDVVDIASGLLGNITNTDTNNSEEGEW